MTSQDSIRTTQPRGAGSTLPIHQDMLSMFRASVADRGDEPALLYFDRAVGYAELDRLSDALAVWLLDKAVQPGDRVAIILQNMPQFLIMALAAWKVGAIPMPGNPMYKKHELVRIFTDAEPALYLCLDEHAGEVRGAIEQIGCKDRPLLVTSGLEMQTRNDPRVFPAGSAISSAEHRLEDVFTSFAERSPPKIAADPETIALLLYTSGTTGVPKGAMITHRNLSFNGQAQRDWCNLNAGSRILGIAPLFHITGFSCYLSVLLSAHATLILHYRVEPSLVLDAIREHRPTYTIGAITAFNALMNVCDLTSGDMESFDRIYSGGAPIPPALRDNIEARFGMKIHSSYGMTETTAPTHMAPYGAQIPIDPASGALSIGVTMPFTQSRIVDENNVEVPMGESGELLIRGPQIMVGYWRRPEETAATLNDGWLKTGDVAFTDADGWYYLVDRKKDVIIASGFKVWPREVEDVLYAHPAVREAAIVGVADAYRGETVKGFISLKDGMTVEPQSLIDHCRKHLAAYKIPRSIEILEELPKTVTGKIQRVALR